MAPLKKIYLEELARIQERINSLFEQALLTSEYDDPDGSLPGTWAPAVDVIETEDSYLHSSFSHEVHKGKHEGHAPSCALRDLRVKHRSTAGMPVAYVYFFSSTSTYSASITPSSFFCSD